MNVYPPFSATILVVAALSLGDARAAESIDAPPPFDSHEAVYSMALSHARLGGGIASASGDMYYKFADACDGWTVENRFILNIAFHNGASTSSNVEFLSWESKDGHTYRFRMRTTQDGVLRDEIRGSAQTNENDEGVAILNIPDERELPLAKGTLFPTRHTAQLLEAAAQGKQFQERLVFDGTTTDSSYLVSAMIGQKSMAAHPSSPGIDKNLLTPPSWPMQVAFFANSEQSLTPDFEMTARYYSNGVADDIVQIFDAFSLKGTMMKLEVAPKPDC